MTMEETYRKIPESEELRNRYTGITDAGALEELLEELGCRESAGEFMKYVKIKSEGEIPDADVGKCGRRSQWKASTTSAS